MIALCMADRVLGRELAAALTMGGHATKLLPGCPRRFDDHYDAIIIEYSGRHAQFDARVRGWRRAAGRRVMLCLLSRDSIAARVAALNAGADDVIATPPSGHAIRGAGVELVARVGALLRRTRDHDHGRRHLLACDDLRIDLVARAVHRAQHAIIMPPREFDLLARLARTPDQPVARADLLKSVWRIGFDPGTNRVDVHVARLRQRIDAPFADRPSPHAMLRTCKGVGYALVSRAGAAIPAFATQ